LNIFKHSQTVSAGKVDPASKDHHLHKLVRLSPFVYFTQRLSLSHSFFAHLQLVFLLLSEQQTFIGRFRKTSYKIVSPKHTFLTNSTAYCLQIFKKNMVNHWYLVKILTQGPRYKNVFVNNKVYDRLRTLPLKISLRKRTFAPIYHITSYQIVNRYVL